MAEPVITASIKSGATKLFTACADCSNINVTSKTCPKFYTTCGEPSAIEVNLEIPGRYSDNDRYEHILKNLDLGTHDRDSQVAGVRSTGKRQEDISFQRLNIFEAGACDDNLARCAQSHVDAHTAVATCIGHQAQL